MSGAAQEVRCRGARARRGERAGASPSAMARGTRASCRPLPLAAQCSPVIPCRVVGKQRLKASVRGGRRRWRRRKRRARNTRRTRRTHIQQDMNRSSLETSPSRPPCSSAHNLKKRYKTRHAHCRHDCHDPFHFCNLSSDLCYALCAMFALVFFLYFLAVPLLTQATIFVRCVHSMLRLVC